MLADVKTFFRPEFLNRLDEQLVFHPIGSELMLGLVDKQIALLGERVRESGVVLQVSDDARKKLAELGYEPSLGARPLLRVIRTSIENELAKLMISGETQDCTVLVKLGDDGEIQLEKASAEIEYKGGKAP